MIHSDDESPVAMDDPEAPAANPRKAIVWILVAFGFLIAGLVGGTILYAWREDLAWTVPLACFVGYVLAFRRGMRLWDPETDRTWRQYLGLDGRTAGEKGGTFRGPNDDPSRSPKNLLIVRPETPRPPRHELRVVR